MSAVRRDMKHAPKLQALKIATEDLIRSVGGTTEAAKHAGRRQQHFSDCQGRNTDQFIRIDEVMTLEDVTAGNEGWPHVTRALAKRQNCIVVGPLPSEAPAACDFHRAIGHASKEFGEVVEAICEAISDDETPGAITAYEVEKKRVIENIDEAMEKLLVLRALASNAPEGSA